MEQTPEMIEGPWIVVCSVCGCVKLRRIPRPIGHDVTVWHRASHGWCGQCQKRVAGVDLKPEQLIRMAQACDDLEILREVQSVYRISEFMICDLCLDQCVRLLRREEVDLFLKEYS